MTIEANPAPTTPPEDQEVLRKVYQDQVDIYRADLRAANEREEELAAQITPLVTAREEALREAARSLGRIDELFRLAARDGITLD